MPKQKSPVATHVYAKKTKIIATIGPNSEHSEIIESLIKHGVNVVRFNMKHGTVDWHERNIDKVQGIADNLGVPIGILIDLQGPEIRIHTRDKSIISVNAGSEVKFVHKFTHAEDQICIPHRSVFEALKKGDRFVIDDGFIQMTVSRVFKGGFFAKAHDNYAIKHMKSMNLFGVDLKLPSLIKDDIDRLHLAVSKKVDYVALSFVRSKQDIAILKREMKKKRIEAQVVAKIESQRGIDNIEEIIEHSDAIMIARGDLGVETPIEKLAYYQKTLINKCRIAGKPVIVATQMLQSMIENPLPTRAEATDVANAVLDGTDALMLSGETASGKYPVKAVGEMARIARFNEDVLPYVKFDIKPDTATEVIVEAAEAIAEKAEQVHVDKIIVLTETGYTARILSSFRPRVPILAVTDSQKTVETLTLSFGVTPVRVKFPNQGRVLSVDSILNNLVTLNKLKKGETVVLIHGQHWKSPGQTNAVVLVEV